jgi:hypothetical protein
MTLQSSPEITRTLNVVSTTVHGQIFSGHVNDAKDFASVVSSSAKLTYMVPNVDKKVKMDL